MNTLRAAIFPHRIDQKIFWAFSGRHGHWLHFGASDFLYYVFFGIWSPGAEGIICDFFHSKSRACEYYLGECRSYMTLVILLNCGLIIG